MCHRILAADADPFMREMYRLYFPRFGFEIATASDGVECLSQVREFRPDALVLGLELLWGGADGVLAALRENSDMPPIPVILTVRRPEAGRAARYLVAPVVKLLENPFLLPELRVSVEAALADKSRMSTGSP